MLHTEVL